MKIMFIHKLRASDSSCCRIVGCGFIMRVRLKLRVGEDEAEAEGG